MSTHHVLRERYELGDVIGSGATADVHLARDLRSGRSVAIKVTVGLGSRVSKAIRPRP